MIQNFTRAAPLKIGCVSKSGRGLATSKTSRQTIAGLCLAVALAAQLATLAAQSASINRVLELDGTNSFVELPPNIFNNLTQATVEAWVKGSPGSPGVRFFSYGEFNHDVGLEAQTDGTLRFFLQDADTGEQNIFAAGVLPAGEWFHVASARHFIHRALDSHRGSCRAANAHTFHGWATRCLSTLRGEITACLGDPIGLAPVDLSPTVASILSSSLSSDGSLLAVGGAGGLVGAVMETNRAAIELLDLQDSQRLARLALESPVHNAPRVAISFDRRLAAILNRQNTAGESQLDIWHLARNDQAARMKLVFGESVGLTFSLDSKYLAATFAGGILVLDTARFEPVMTLRGYFGQTSGAVLGPNGTLMAVPVFRENAIRLFNVLTGTETAYLRTPGAPFLSQLSQDGSVLTSTYGFGAKDGIRCFRRAVREEKLRLLGHVGGVPAVAFSQRAHRGFPFQRRSRHLEPKRSGSAVGET